MSDKHTPGAFREAFKGYNKDDVNAYIQLMFHQFEERERSIQKRINQAPQPAAPDPEQIEALQAQIADRDGLIAQKDAEIAALQARIAEMTENSSRYEKMSAQVGDIMLRARGDADHLLDEAGKQAEQILAKAGADADQVRAKANTYADSIRTEALKQADTIISYASDRMKHLYHEETEGYAKVLDTLRHQTEHFAEKLAQYRESFPSEVEDAREIAKESVRQMAIGLDQQE